MKDEQSIIWNNLNESQREVADIIGLENYIKLIKFVNGDAIYIPQYDKLVTDEKIKSGYDGYNIKELARQYKVTPRTIYKKIPKELRIAQKNRPIDGQIRF